MKRVDIKVTFKCNNCCKFCVQGDKRRIFPDKAAAELKSVLRSCRDEGIRGVVFTGGEPTLREDILDLIKFSRALGFKAIQLQSNGRLFSYPDFCKKIIQAGASEFSPAVHGHNGREHDFLTSAKGSFRQTIKGIENLKNLNQYVLTNTVITSYNYKSLPKIAKLLVNLGVDQFQFAFVHIIGTAALNAGWIVPKKKDTEYYIKKGLDIGIKAGRKVMTEAVPYCFMKNYEQYLAEKIIPYTKIIDHGRVIDDFTKIRAGESKSKGPECKFCRNNSICEGPWKEYPKKFGWGEFKPIPGK